MKDFDVVNSCTGYYFKIKRGVGMKRIINGFLVTFVLLYGVFIFLLFSQSTGTDSSERTTTQGFFTPLFSRKKNFPLFYGHESLLEHPEAFRPKDIKVSPLDYNFTINSPPACPSTSNNPTLFILILTQHDAYKQRKAIRDTWGRIARHEPWPGRRLLGEVRLIFLLGAINNAPLNKEVQNEASEHRDIVEANFTDSYFNLTYKVLMGIKWVNTYCPHTKYIMKMDEDVFVDMPRLVSILMSVSPGNVIFGPYSYAEKVVRPNPNGNSSKGAVACGAYSPEWYPPHVKGNFYIMPYSLAVKIMNISEYFTYVNIEDAYITGILAKVFEARHLEISPDQYDKQPELDLDYCAFVLEKKIASQKVYPELLYNFWKRIEKTELCGIIRVDKVVKEFLINIDQHIHNITKENQLLAKDDHNVNNQHISRDNQNLSNPKHNQNLNIQRDNQTLNIPKHNQTLNIPKHNQNLTIQKDNQNLNIQKATQNLNIQRDNQNLNIERDNQNLQKRIQKLPRYIENMRRNSQTIPR